MPTVPKKEAERKFVWGEGSDKVAMFEERNRTDETNDLHRACEWRGKKFDAGFGWITGPVEYGGRGLPGAYEKAWNALEAQYQVPNQAAFTIGLGMVAPTILAHGSEAAKQSYLTKMYRADIVGCQLFSEPGAGSDLASLQTKAERDGEEWVITGQKVWTTGAHYSDIGEIIARTDPRPAEAQGPDRVHRRHEGARRRGAPASPDDRRRELQRGLLQRGPRAGRRPPR